MLFNSYIFVVLFLPLALGLHWIARRVYGHGAAVIRENALTLDSMAATLTQLLTDAKRLASMSAAASSVIWLSSLLSVTVVREWRFTMLKKRSLDLWYFTIRLIVPK